MTIHDTHTHTHTHTHTLTHRENFSDGLTKLEAYVIPLPVINQLMGSHPLTNYTMMYVLFSSFTPCHDSILPLLSRLLRQSERELMIVNERINLKKIPLLLLGSTGSLIITILLGLGGVLRLLWSSWYVFPSLDRTISVSCQPLSPTRHSA
jgi:hypothetical protein